MSSEKAKKIVDDIKRGVIKNVYFLMGEEAYYIDAIANFIESAVLSEEEKGFNQMVLYGRDVSIDDIVSHAKRYPMMAERQVIIVREAQDLSRAIENLVAYVESPQPTTVLVFCYKYKTLDKRKKLSKAIAKNDVLFESKKLYENQVPDWIRRVLSGRGYTITPKAGQMLADFLGNDLAKINKELEKLEGIIKPGDQITPQLIDENIGISKDFNNFELLKAIGAKNAKKTFAIMQYFFQNPGKKPVILTNGILYSFFAKLLKYHSLSNKGDAVKVLKISPYFIKDYELAARNYSMKKVSAVISSIREIDMKAKGVGASNLSQADLLKELLVKVLN